MVKDTITFLRTPILAGVFALGVCQHVQAYQPVSDKTHSEPNDIHYDSVLPEAEPAPAKIHERVEEKPMFSGGTEALNKHLSENLTYPRTALENGIQGTVPVRFVVEPSGEITNVKVMRPVDPLLDAAAVKYVQGMPNWIPGKQNDIPVRVYAMIPVRFRIQQPMPALTGPVFHKPNMVFEKVDEMPKFPGGEKALKKFFKKNLRYPEISGKNKIEGLVHVGFAVEKDGSITQIKILKSTNRLFDGETARAINLMPKWEPGKQDGKPVKVWVVLPIVFRLPK